jgi:hypothetical protein
VSKLEDEGKISTELLLSLSLLLLLPSLLLESPGSLGSPGSPSTELLLEGSSQSSSQSCSIEEELLGLITLPRLELLGSIGSQSSQPSGGISSSSFFSEQAKNSAPAKTTKHKNARILCMLCLLIYTP